MSQVAIEYVDLLPDGGWRVAGSRVSLASVVHAYWEGKSPEAIVEEFPTLSAERVYGAIAFYLRFRSEVDDYLAQQGATWEQLRRESQDQHGPLLDRIRVGARAAGAGDPPQ